MTEEVYCIRFPLDTMEAREVWKLWRWGMDTMKIAEKMRAPECAVANTLGDWLDFRASKPSLRGALPVGSTGNDARVLPSHRTPRA